MRHSVALGTMVNLYYYETSEKEGSAYLAHVGNISVIWVGI